MLETGYGENMPPTIVSHGAVNGLSWKQPDNQVGESVFYPSDINFFDEEIETIGRSGGLFAIQFDTRRIARENHVRKSVRSLFRNEDAGRSALMIWHQMLHIAEVLDRAGIFGWGTACIGSDYDGTIDPLPGIWTAEYFPLLQVPLWEYAASYLKNTNRMVLPENLKISPDEIVERFFIGNTINFLRKFYK